MGLLESEELFCPEYLNFTLQGQSLSEESKVLTVYFDYCNQEHLDSLGKNQTCVSREETNEVIEQMDAVLFYYSQSFNTQEISNIPINNQIKAQFYNLKSY